MVVRAAKLSRTNRYSFTSTICAKGFRRSWFLKRCSRTIRFYVSILRNLTHLCSPSEARRKSAGSTVETNWWLQKDSKCALASKEHFLRLGTSRGPYFSLNSWWRGPWIFLRSSNPWEKDMLNYRLRHLFLSVSSSLRPLSHLAYPAPRSSQRKTLLLYLTGPLVRATIRRVQTLLGGDSEREGWDLIQEERTRWGLPDHAGW